MGLLVHGFLLCAHIHDPWSILIHTPRKAAKCRPVSIFVIDFLPLSSLSSPHLFSPPPGFTSSPATVLLCSCTQATELLPAAIPDAAPRHLPPASFTAAVGRRCALHSRRCPAVRGGSSPPFAASHRRAPHARGIFAKNDARWRVETKPRGATFFGSGSVGRLLSAGFVGLWCWSCFEDILVAGLHMKPVVKPVREPCQRGPKS